MRLWTSMRLGSQTRHVVGHPSVKLCQLSDQNLQVMQCEHVAWGWMRQLLVLNSHEAPLKINCQIKYKGKEDQNTATYDVVNFFDVDVSFVARSICRKLWPQFVQYPHYL